MIIRANSAGLLRNCTLEQLAGFAVEEREAEMGGTLAQAVKDAPIKRDQLELEIQFARDGSSLGPDSCHVHIRCFAAWEFERTKGGPNTG
jgi:hypothetical protein